MLKILIVRLSSLGDIIHTYPMIYDIKQNFPHCELDWLVDESFYDLVKINPLVDNVIPIALRKWKKNIAILDFISWFKTRKTNKKYDYIIDTQGLIKSSLLSKCFSGKIYGYAKDSIKEKFASYFYDYQYSVGLNHLAINKARLLASKIFAYDINLSICNFGINDIHLNQLEFIKTNKYIIFFHATSKSSKKYPSELWAELAKYLINTAGYDIILPYGSSIEYEDAIMIKKLVNSDKIIIPERMNYYQLASLIKHASFVFGVDTGLLHLSNALNKKLIAIYVDTNPAKTGIFESNIAKNIGGINDIPNVIQLVQLFENLLIIQCG